MTSLPKAFSTSTPKILNIRKRRGIGEPEESIQSPIPNDDDDSNYSQQEDYQSNSEEDLNLDHDSHSDPLPEYISPLYRTDTKNRQSICGYQLIIFCVLIVLSLGSLFLVSTDETIPIKSNNTIEKLSSQFPSQIEDFWLQVDVAIGEVNRWHKPQTVIFLYQDDRKKTVESILKEISEYAVCQITQCSSTPVDINGISLRERDILSDYGRVIAHNKEQLENSGVMIIRNLEKVPGKSAQAFHSICDEHNPVVGKALILFTIKLDSVEDVKKGFIENHLRNLWRDLDDDRFYPLFTRISSNILPVMID